MPFSIFRQEGRPLTPSQDVRVFATAPPETDKALKSSQSSEVEAMQCACCGMSEECTPTYVARIRELHAGEWICGLCSEAVKELKRRDQTLTMEEALKSQMSFCMQFNRTIRLNPKLSFAGAMRDIAKKNSQRRSFKGSPSSSPSSSSKIGRSNSSLARVDAN